MRNNPSAFPTDSCVACDAPSRQDFLDTWSLQHCDQGSQGQVNAVRRKSREAHGVPKLRFGLSHHVEGLFGWLSPGWGGGVGNQKGS